MGYWWSQNSDFGKRGLIIFNKRAQMQPCVCGDHWIFLVNIVIYWVTIQILGWPCDELGHRRFYSVFHVKFQFAQNLWVATHIFCSFTQLLCGVNQVFSWFAQDFRKVTQGLRSWTVRRTVNVLRTRITDAFCTC